jgi:hypothetical protein
MPRRVEGEDHETNVAGPFIQVVDPLDAAFRIPPLRYGMSYL